MKKIYLSLIIFFVVQTNSFSGEYLNRFANCLMQNTTERDKVVLVRWMFSAIAQHSALESEFNISAEKSTNHEIAVADYMQYILGSICLEEAKNVLNYEGEDAFAKSFEYLGEVAMMSLIDDPNVNRALENWIIHLDPNFIKKFE
tara:strand:- start:53 stop:487 length:435 start_codon:yes stop_codon:yes gene_type:complete